MGARCRRDLGLPDALSRDFVPTKAASTKWIEACLQLLSKMIVISEEIYFKLHPMSRLQGENEPAEPASLPTPRETAGYVGRIAGELRTMTVSSDLGFLAFLLSMVEERRPWPTVKRLSDK